MLAVLGALAEQAGAGACRAGFHRRQGHPGSLRQLDDLGRVLREAEAHSAAIALRLAEDLAIWLNSRSAFFSSSRFCCSRSTASLWPRSLAHSISVP